MRLKSFAWFLMAVLLLLLLALAFDRHGGDLSNLGALIHGQRR